MTYRRVLIGRLQSIAQFLFVNQMSIITVENLTKIFKTFDRREGVIGSLKDLVHRNYRDFKAVDQISFQLQPGELVGYIGPNGAGKSTSIKMLTGILSPTGGKIDVMGFDPFRDRKIYARNIGVVFGQRTQLWWDIAVQESFRLLAKIYGVAPKDYEARMELLGEVLGLEEFLRTPVRKLSLGQRMRADLAASLLHKPPILFLDEPTVGLDAVAKESIRLFLRRINREYNTTIILTTHDLDEIEELCSRIIIIDHGKIIFDGPLKEIKSLPGLKKEITIDFSRNIETGDSVDLGSDVEILERTGRRIRAAFDPQQSPTPELIKNVVTKYEIADLTVMEPRIEDVVKKIYREGSV